MKTSNQRNAIKKLAIAKPLSSKTQKAKLYMDWNWLRYNSVAILKFLVNDAKNFRHLYSEIIVPNSFEYSVHYLATPTASSYCNGEHSDKGLLVVLQFPLHPFRHNSD